MDPDVDKRFKELEVAHAEMREDLQHLAANQKGSEKALEAVAGQIQSANSTVDKVLDSLHELRDIKSREEGARAAVESMSKERKEWAQKAELAHAAAQEARRNAQTDREQAWLMRLAKVETVLENLVPLVQKSAWALGLAGLVGTIVLGAIINNIMTKLAALGAT